MNGSTVAAESCWYVVQTKPKQEQRAEQSLRLSDVETFAPRTRELSPLRMGSESGYRLAPLFPRYIFARFCLEQLPRIRMTSGVHEVVSFGSGPARVEEEVIALLRARVAESEAGPAAPVLEGGDHVVVQDGPLRNLAGIFEREVNGPERVAVLLSAIHFQARTILDSRQLARV